MSNFNGIIIEESLEDKGVLSSMKILKTEVESVTEEHKTPWVKQWTLHSVEIEKNQAADIAEKLSHALDAAHANSWYADLKSDDIHYVIFRDKVFMVDRSQPEQYDQVIQYGLSIGIPAYQLDFSPHINEWKR